MVINASMGDDYDSRNHCQNNGHYCDKSQYGELGFWEYLKMQIHLIFCKSCRQYRKKNKKLTQVIEKAGISTLSREEVEKIKSRLRQHPEE
ncbi:MAG TPA: hypothetical protein VK010_05315 [Flavobacteriaceae bacterium]|nr:hypothetical protein [Flavobacteriaceae bacterium]